ncbi:MAG: hypothetical protein OXL40_05865 [Bacteroidota bacterium]|nr:hypothetical protein [Bacteroidota bacterium]
MAPIFERRGLPDHLFQIPCLDFQEDICADRLGGQWFRLGACTIDPQRDNEGVEEAIERRSLLLEPEDFSEIYDGLDYVPSVVGALGRPGGSVRSSGEHIKYSYDPFYQFNLGSVRCEPLVFIHYPHSKPALFINPDLLLYFELEKKSDGPWLDRRSGTAVLRDEVIGNTLWVVDIESGYLWRYLRARQQSLLVAHYRRGHLIAPCPESVEKFVKGEVRHGSVAQGAKAIFQNLGSSERAVEASRLIERRLHLWFEIKSSKIDIDDPWTEEAPFDQYAFTLPTRKGPVAPDSFRTRIADSERNYHGVNCGYMETVYFKQEVLLKYELSPLFDVQDDGSVSCQNYWGLRSTGLIGNELVYTAIGDFAEELPREEWPHWKRHAVKPPSREDLQVIHEEVPIPSAVNRLVQELTALDSALVEFAEVIEAGIPGPFWSGSKEILRGRQLKLAYPTTAGDQEFVKRATLMSTLVLNGLDSKSLRGLLRAFGKNLHYKNFRKDKGPSLGSRKLLERVTLIAILIKHLQPPKPELFELLEQAEGGISNGSAADLQTELVLLCQQMRSGLAPLAKLYDLRTHGGIAHEPVKEEIVLATAELGLPGEGWNRTHYLILIDRVAKSLRLVHDHLIQASDILPTTA